MLSLQGIGGFCVIRDLEHRRLPALDGVARRAFAAVGPLRELSGMGIGPVTTGALRKRDRPLEITGDVALGACNRYMFPEEWELGCAVIKFAAERRR